MSYDPFKCPDCGTWWRGETHKCASLSKPTTGAGSPRKGWISCPMCGKNITKYDWHSCNAQPHKKESPHDHRPPQWNA